MLKAGRVPVLVCDMMTELLIITHLGSSVLEKYLRFMVAFEYGFSNFPVRSFIYFSDERLFGGFRKNHILGLKVVMRSDPITEV